MLMLKNVFLVVNVVKFVKKKFQILGMIIFQIEKKSLTEKTYGILTGISDNLYPVYQQVVDIKKDGIYKDNEVILYVPDLYVYNNGSIIEKDQYVGNKCDIEEIISLYSGRAQFEPLDMIKYYDFWRLFYVAFSRAQSLLVMLCDESKANEPSKYFEYMYDELPYSTDYSKFQFEKIKNSNIKNSYSFTSDINAYMVCPTQYKYFKELGFEPVRIGSTLFGTIVHETIEDIHKAVLKGDVNSVTEENIKKWLEINYKTASKLNNYYLTESNLNSAFEQITSYVNEASKNWEAIKDAEMPITLSQKKYIINGKVDLVVNSKGKYEILDFKTEKKPQINKEKEKVERVRRQLEIYGYLIENFKTKCDEKIYDVAFIGPCAAKKLEASRKSVRSDVDFVLTSFDETLRELRKGL